jgi:hypothetical protein
MIVCHDVELIQVMTCLPTSAANVFNGQKMRRIDAVIAIARKSIRNGDSIVRSAQPRHRPARSFRTLPAFPPWDRCLTRSWGLSIAECLSLTRKFGDLSDLVRTYFEFGFFNVIRIDVKLISIYVPPGCQLTFRTWLGLQPSFADVDLETELLDGAYDLGELRGEVDGLTGDFLNTL